MKKNYEKGFFAALGCAGLWGILPIYWKSLIPIPSSTIIIYRILMIAVVCVIAARFRVIGQKELVKTAVVVENSTATAVISFLKEDIGWTKRVGKIA